jgi:hypothetical protein
MNDKRVSFVLPPDHKINIISYWLLKEKHGSMLETKQNFFLLIFRVGQTITQKAIIEAIAQFLNNLIPKNFLELKNRPNFIHIEKKDLYIKFTPPL